MRFRPAGFRPAVLGAAIVLALALSASVVTAQGTSTITSTGAGPITLGDTNDFVGAVPSKLT